MRFTDIFIRRPVLATVVSLIILLLGLRSMQELDLRQFPEVETTQITISTFYPGADAELVQGFITTPIQQAISSADGIDYITSSSRQGMSTITAHLQLNFDRNAALTEIMAKVNEVRNILPPAAESPVIQSSDIRGAALAYISFYSETMDGEQVTDYLVRVVQPKLQTLEGVSQAQVLGARTFAMRVWLDPLKLAAFNVTAAEVATALQQNNFLAAVGSTKGENIALEINADTALSDPEGFGSIVIRSDENGTVRIRDVAEVELGSESYDSSVRFTGQRAVFMAISGNPDANPLDVIARVRETMPQIRDGLPPGLHTEMVYDATEYIADSIDEVVNTIVEAGLIVIVVIFLFLGALRAVAIPVITIPLSLVGVMFFMLSMGYSLNLLTLLAMVLAIGLVVDDAIVVVENVHRHIEEGLSPKQAALQGAREIAVPVITMTLTLAAVYAPIGFLGGLTGNLFREFAFTLAGAVVVSGIIALTLSPMMCARFLKPAGSEGRLAQYLDHKFETLRHFYLRKLHGALDTRPVIVVIAVVVLVSCVFLYTSAQQELSPTEDQGFVFVMGTGPRHATHEYMEEYANEIDGIFKDLKEMDAYFMVNGMGSVNSLIAGFILKPWGERERSQAEVQQDLQQRLAGVAGLQSVAISFPSLPGASGMPVQFVVSSTDRFANIFEVSQSLMQAAQQSGLFAYIDMDLKYNNPQLEMHIDREKAAELGIDMSDIGSSLATLLGGGYVNRFSLEGRSYKVIPQVRDEFRRVSDQLNQYYIRTSTGETVPLSTVVSFSQRTQPSQLTQFQQLNSATIQGVPRPGVSLGQALDFLEQKAAEIFPEGYYVNYAGESRQFVEEGSALLLTFFFALLVIYLVLAAQFESFRDPFIILVSVPMSLCGALIPLTLGAATINIYTQVGLVTLIGLISKHGILMVEFANKLQEEKGLSVRQAIEEAASIRLRPILMTTAAIVLAVFPLILASGAGAESRYSIGLVIATGMTIGTAFTLFVVPAMYTFFARDHHRETTMEQ